MELPAASDLFYFRMERANSARMWQADPGGKNRGGALDRE